jgi:hypothetical protein
MHKAMCSAADTQCSIAATALPQNQRRGFVWQIYSYGWPTTEIEKSAVFQYSSESQAVF